MAKLKNPDKVPNVGADTFQNTTTETDISLNTATDAETNSATETVTDTEKSVQTDVESKATVTVAAITTTETGTTIGAGTGIRTGTGNVSESKVKIIASKSTEKEKLSTQKRSEKSNKEEPDSFTLEILKSFSNYESLYINRKGGTYVPNTPESIRGSAILYKNPYFKS